MRDERDISRRAFLGGAAVLGGASILSGIVGCSKPAADSSESIEWDYTSDVVVVGGGTGLVGALLATHNGHSVTILEKSAAVGGTTKLSGGVVWCPCNRWSEPAGVDTPWTEDEALAYLQAADVYHGSTDESKRDYISNFHKVMEYVEDEIGFSYRPVNWMYNYDKAIGAYKKGISLAFQDPEKGEVFEGKYLVERFLSAIQEKGGEVVTEATATALIKDSGGRVIGVKADTSSGEIYAKAEKGVILSAGGFDFNDEMRTKYLRGPYFFSYAVPQNTGDGIRLGQSIGADLGNMGSSLGGSIFLTKYEPYSFGKNIAAWDVLCEYRAAPHTIIVNIKGRRFIDESTPYAIYPDSAFNYDSEAARFTNIPGYMIFTDKHVELKGWPNKETSQPEYVKKFDTLDAVAAEYAIDAANLKAEVERFNGFCETGDDLDFSRGTSPWAKSVGFTTLGSIEGPYYVVLVVPALLGTKGGLKVNLNCQVIDVNNQVIEGLYAAGLNASGILGSTYAGFGGGVGPGFYQNFRAADHALGLSIIG
ncbi:MAG: FAD-dependent oxidoreductase [Coriobacteriia bacterium]